MVAQSHRCITRRSTCICLQIPQDLACDICFQQMQQTALGKKSRSKKSYLQPWHEKWGSNRELGKVRKHLDVRKFLQCPNECALIDTYKYGKRDVEHDDKNNNYLSETQRKDKLLLKKQIDLTAQADTSCTNNEQPISVLQLASDVVERAPYPPSEKLSSAASNEVVDENLTPTTPIPELVLDESSSQQSKFKFYSVSKSSYNQQFTVNIPTSHKLCHKSHFSMLVDKAAKFDAIIETITKPRYSGTDLGDWILGYAASAVPQCGFSGLSTILPLAVASVFINSGIHIDPDLIVGSQPCRNKILDIVTQNATETILLTKASVLKNPVIYISVDKGNKKGNKNLAKYIFWYNNEKKKVQTFLLDVDCTDETSADVAQALAH